MFYLIVIAIYLLFVALIVFFCHRRGLGWLGKLIVIVFLLLAPFWDMFLAKGIMWNYARANNPLQEITRTVEKPESVLWIDNVWPGYDEYGRHWMVTNYLDGVHLKLLAINGNDGRFYLYRASLSNFSESETLLSKHEQLKKKIKQLEDEAKQFGRSGGDNKGLWQIIRQDYYPQIKELGYENQRKKEINQIFSKPEIYQKEEELPSKEIRGQVYC